MSVTSASGTMGELQLLAFLNAGNHDAVQTAARELGFAKSKIENGDAQQATAYLKDHASPEILLVEIGSQEEAPAQLDALADVVNPHTKVLATGKVDSIRFYQWLGDLGIEGYLLQPFTAVELKQAIAKGAIRKPEKAEDKEQDAKKIIAVIGARGGVGTTMVATNLGAMLARDLKLMTAVVDLDLYFGSVALSLDLEAGRGLRDAFEKPDRVDAIFLERVMIKPFNELSILSAEEPLMDPINMQPNAGEMMFAALREKFKMIVVDVPRQMNPMSRHVLAHADHVIIVAEPQIISLRDSLRIKDFLVDHLKRPAPIMLLNRVGLSSGNELSAKEFAKNFGQEPAAQLAFMQEVIAATAQGELLTSSPKLSALAASLRGLAKRIGGVKPEQKKSEQTAGANSLMARLKGKK